MQDSRLVTQAKIELDQTERVILAEGALKREVAVAWVRILAIVGFTATMSTLAITRGDTDLYRPWVGGFYLVFSISVLRGVKAAIKEPRSNRWLRSTAIWTIIVPVVDFVVNVLLQVLPVQSTTENALPALHPERAAVTFAMLIVFSFARPSWKHVAFSVALAEAAYFFCLYSPRFMYGVGPVSLMRGGADLELPISSVYITVAYVLIGVLVARAQQLMRDDFRGVRRLSNLKRFLPAVVAERVYERGESSLHPISREVTVMFTDIRDFTSQSEKLQPSEVLELLDFYFGHMSQIVKGHDGVVGKFIGDGMLAFWGAPEKNEHHAQAAVRAALDMRRKLIEINAQRAKENKEPLRIGVGVHTGLVAAGLLGGAEAALSEYTVIGDAVNLASRIEGLNKDHHTDILVSETTWAQARSVMEADRIGEAHVKGRAEPVVLYKVIGPAVQAGTAPAPIPTG